MNTAYLSLGSNEGDRRQWLERALALIAEKCGAPAVRSAIYQTAAWGLNDQPDFLNMAAEIHTQLSPYDLLAAMLEIERVLGRTREIKWGPRTLDIDILFFNDSVLYTPELTIPHPFVHVRRFTLLPMAEIAPQYIHPLLRSTIAQLLADCPDTLEVRKVI